MKRTTYFGEVIASAQQVYGTFQFKLSDLPNFTEITTLFQLYRINCVVMKFMPGYSDVAAGQVTRLPVMHMANDFNTIAPWTSPNEAFQYQGLKSIRTDKPFSWKIFPKAIIDAYTGGVSGASILPKARQWCSTATGGENVLHYGVKYYLDSPALSTNTTIKIYCTFYLSAKVPK